MLNGLPQGFDYSGVSWDSLTWYENKRYRLFCLIDNNILRYYYRWKFRIVNYGVVIDDNNCYKNINGRMIRQGSHDYHYNYFNDRICGVCSFAPEGHKPVEEIMVQVRRECKCGHAFESHTLENGLGCIECDCESINAFHDVDWRPSDEIGSYTRKIWQIKN